MFTYIYFGKSCQTYIDCQMDIDKYRYRVVY